MAIWCYIPSLRLKDRVVLLSNKSLTHIHQESYIKIIWSLTSNATENTNISSLFHNFGLFEVFKSAQKSATIKLIESFPSMKIIISRIEFVRKQFFLFLDLQIAMYDINHVENIRLEFKANRTKNLHYDGLNFKSCNKWTFHLNKHRHCLPQWA